MCICLKVQYIHLCKYIDLLTVTWCLYHTLKFINFSENYSLSPRQLKVFCSNNDYPAICCLWTKCNITVINTRAQDRPFSWCMSFGLILKFDFWAYKNKLFKYAPSEKSNVFLFSMAELVEKKKILKFMEDTLKEGQWLKEWKVRQCPLKQPLLFQ